MAGARQVRVFRSRNQSERAARHTSVRPTRLLRRRGRRPDEAGAHVVRLFGGRRVLLRPGAQFRVVPNGIDAGHRARNPKTVGHVFPVLHVDWQCRRRPSGVLQETTAPAPTAQP